MKKLLKLLVVLFLASGCSSFDTVPQRLAGKYRGQIVDKEGEYVEKFDSHETITLSQPKNKEDKTGEAEYITGGNVYSGEYEIDTDNKTIKLEITKDVDEDDYLYDVDEDEEDEDEDEYNGKYTLKFTYNAEKEELYYYKNDDIYWVYKKVKSSAYNN